MPAVPVTQTFTLALQHHQAGRLADAEALYRQILTVQPHHAEALYLLGVIAHQLGRNDLAVEQIHRALAVAPENFAAHFNLGGAYHSLGRLEEAMAAYRRALALQPDFPEAYNNLGNALRERGQLEEAVAACRRALELRPDFPEACNNLGVALTRQGHLDEAVAAYRRALALNPSYPDAWNNLGGTLTNQEKLDEAAAACRQALQLQPGFAVAHYNLGNALRDRGQLDEALASFRQALQLKPGFIAALSTLIQTALYHPAFDRRALREECQRWEKQHAQPLRRFINPHGNTPDPARPLRIGYVSPDFRDNVIGRYLVPLFHCHDHEQFEVLSYSGVVQPDDLTEKFRQGAGQWRSTVGVGDEALVEMIRHDGVDILVDLTQHAPGNRLPVFARQPAPVQVSFAGYPESTGLTAIGTWKAGMGIRISDLPLLHLGRLARPRLEFQMCRSGAPHQTSNIKYQT